MSVQAENLLKPSNLLKPGNLLKLGQLSLAYAGLDQVGCASEKEAHDAPGAKASSKQAGGRGWVAGMIELIAV